MGADSSFYVKTIETHAHAFLTLNILAIGRVLLIDTFEHPKNCLIIENKLHHFVLEKKLILRQFILISRLVRTRNA